MGIRIPIRAAKEVARKYGLSHVIMLVHHVSSNTDHVITYGETTEQCSQAADFGNTLKKALGWPDKLQAQPSRVKKLEARIKELEDRINGKT